MKSQAFFVYIVLTLMVFDIKILLVLFGRLSFCTRKYMKTGLKTL